MDTPITAKAALLQALIEGEGYGLELIERVRTRTHGRVKLHQGSIYPALRAGSWIAPWPGRASEPPRQELAAGREIGLGS